MRQAGTGNISLFSALRFPTMTPRSSWRAQITTYILMSCKHLIIEQGFDREVLLVILLSDGCPKRGKMPLLGAMGIIKASFKVHMSPAELEDQRIRQFSSPSVSRMDFRSFALTWKGA